MKIAQNITPELFYTLSIYASWLLLRRLECALEPTRAAVCAALEEHEDDYEPFPEPDDDFNQDDDF